MMQIRWSTAGRPQPGFRNGKRQGWKLSRAIRSARRSLRYLASLGRYGSGGGAALTAMARRLRSHLRRRLRIPHASGSLMADLEVIAQRLEQIAVD
ncbi:hypothetical protein [Novosphingobium sp. JCM 18896]|uniref:hypothetical protein n=1 Tax=Novosphingobium sp. JCM 18896 TaxID=2989731 RepID=UPI002222C56A|nr:hypothetical protein [Novosphingobium sp. JCM 18896]MCW1431634.1 hypothetical protein [Novosphingobium sp. JCM 18896]